jgi:hypothetical protein
VLLEDEKSDSLNLPSYYSNNDRSTAIILSQNIKAALGY